MEKPKEPHDKAAQGQRESHDTVFRIFKPGVRIELIVFARSGQNLREASPLPASWEGPCILR